MISIDNIGIFLSSPEAIFKNYNKGYLNLPSIFTREIFSCVLNVLEIFFNFGLETLKLNISGNTDYGNIKNIYSYTTFVRGLSIPGSAVWVVGIGAYW